MQKMLYLGTEHGYTVSSNVMESADDIWLNDASAMVKNGY